MAGTTHHWAVALAMAVGLTTGLTPLAGATPPTCANLQAPRPLPNPALKTIADVMPHKCDDYLWGRWLCGERYRGSDGGPIGIGSHITFSRSMTPEGFERVRYQRDSQTWLDPGEDIFYTVDRQWHPYPEIIVDTGGDMLKRASCNAVSPYGGNYLTLSHKRADGTKNESGWVAYYRSDKPNLIYMQRFKYNPETKGGDPVTKLRLCYRQSP